MNNFFTFFNAYITHIYLTYYNFAKDLNLNFATSLLKLETKGINYSKKLKVVKKKSYNH